MTWNSYPGIAHVYGNHGGLFYHQKSTVNYEKNLPHIYHHTILTTSRTLFRKYCCSRCDIFRRDTSLYEPFPSACGGWYDTMSIDNNIRTAAILRHKIETKTK